MSTQKRTRGASVEKTQPKMAKKGEKTSEMEMSSTGDTSSFELFKMLLTTKVHELKPPEGKIFIAQRDDKVIDVWKGLIRHNFLSVPVLQQTKKKYYGFLDMMDIVNFFVEQFGEGTLKKTEDFWRLIEKEEYFRNTRVRDIMKYPLNRRNPFSAVPVNYSLMMAVELLARERSLHRVPVIDDERKLMGLVTQSRVVSFLRENMDKLGDKRTKTLSSIPRVFHEVYCIDSTAVAMDGFKLITSKNVTGVGVVNEQGKLVGNLSLKDLKAISAEASMFWRLFEPVGDFLGKLKNEFKGMPDNVISVKSQDNLEQVISLLADNKIHRLYIVDDEEKPIGIVSLRDILLEIISSV